MGRGTLFIFLIVVLIILGFACLFLYNSWKISLMKIPPEAPVDLIAEALSATQVKLTWEDKSNNENGFILYRDSTVTVYLQENATEYIDSGLKPATEYQYAIKAYNQAGESDLIVCLAKTLNPPIIVWIDKIGVHDNGEEFFRDFDGGEIHVGIVVTDGDTTINNRLPTKDYYHLKKDEFRDIGTRIFYTEEVGEYLRLVVIGYENDGGFGEDLMYKMLDMATKSYMGGPTSLIFTLAGVDFTDIFSEIFGAEDDWLGTYVSEWTNSDDWGVGKYLDVRCKNEDGTECLRLWFTIECPVYDYSSKETR